VRSISSACIWRALTPWVCQRVARILGADILEEVDNHLNFVWRERHEGEELWVVRKGGQRFRDKRLDEVLSEHADSIRILHTLTPVGVAMAVRTSLIRIRTEPNSLGGVFVGFDGEFAFGFLGH
jgi:hypothetical protein